MAIACNNVLWVGQIVVLMYTPKRTRTGARERLIRWMNEWLYEKNAGWRLWDTLRSSPSIGFVFQFQKKRKPRKTLNCVVIYNAKEKIETVFCYCQQFNSRNIIYLLNCLLLFLPILPIKFKKLQFPWHWHRPGLSDGNSTRCLIFRPL